MRERKIGGLGGLDMACRWTFSIVIKQLNSKMDPENLSDFFFLIYGSFKNKFIFVFIKMRVTK